MKIWDIILRRGIAIMILKGPHIELRPLSLKERYKFFLMATESDSTPFWYGDLYGDTIPSYTIFKHEWPDRYFKDDEPKKGRCFGIYLGEDLIGQVNYNEIDLVEQRSDMDIIIGQSCHHGKGYGTEAIRLLSDHLFEQMSLKICVIEVLSQNPRAFRAYQKAGFIWAYTYVNDGIEWRVMELRKSVWSSKRGVYIENLKKNHKSP
ncbi:MAG: GNAT family N-acetyltransferase [Bacteroidota bacterium]